MSPTVICLDGSDSAEAIMLECPICLDSCMGSTMHAVGGCLHSFCGSCLEEHIKSKMQERSFPIPCPGIACKGCIAVPECLLLLRSPELEERLHKVRFLPAALHGLQPAKFSSGLLCYGGKANAVLIAIGGASCAILALRPL